MGKNNIRKGILRSLCAAVTAFAAAAVPVMGGTTFADTKDYDQEIAQLEQKAEQIKKDNEAREQQIGSLKSDRKNLLRKLWRYNFRNQRDRKVQVNLSVLQVNEREET